MTPFKVMTSLLNNTTPTKEEQGSMNSFFLCRWLSNHPDTLPMANMVNLFYNMPVNIQYNFCKDYIQCTGIKNKVKYIQFNKEQQNTEIQHLLDNIQRYYNVNEIQAQEYFNLMDNKERDRLYNMYIEGQQ